MKKTKALFCTILLSTVLVGNVFATGPSGTGVLNFLTDAIAGVMSLFDAGGGSCPLRQCTNCRPVDRDENGNCRPRE